LLAIGGGAFGGTTTSWSRVTDTGARNIDQVGLARTNDGVLHVVWGRRVGSDESLRHSGIASLTLASGRYGVTAAKAGYSPASARVRVR